MSQKRRPWWIFGCFENPDRCAGCVRAATIVLGGAIMSQVLPCYVYFSWQESNKREKEPKLVKCEYEARREGIR